MGSDTIFQMYEYRQMFPRRTMRGPLDHDRPRVVSIFDQPRDKNWSTEQKEYMRHIAGKMGMSFSQSATPQDWRILAAYWRSRAMEQPNLAFSFAKLARSCEFHARYGPAAVGHSPTT